MLSTEIRQLSGRERINLFSVKQWYLAELRVKEAGRVAGIRVKNELQRPPNSS